jgi:hypothetical protein
MAGRELDHHIDHGAHDPWHTPPELIERARNQQELGASEGLLHAGPANPMGSASGPAERTRSATRLGTSRPVRLLGKKAVRIVNVAERYVIGQPVKMPWDVAITRVAARVGGTLGAALGANATRIELRILVNEQCLAELDMRILLDSGVRGVKLTHAILINQGDTLRAVLSQMDAVPAMVDVHGVRVEAAS